MNYSLQNLDKNEAKIYIDTKLSTAGLKQDIISSDAYQQIINYANGVMRIIDHVMDNALLFLSNRKEDIITGDMMMEAINECSV